MTPKPARVLELVEYGDLRVPAAEIDDSEASMLFRSCGSQLSIEPPSTWNDRNWILRSNGYVGFIPVSERLALRLNPKVPLRTLFGMLEWAYRLDPQWLAGLYDASAIAEFYERLAMVLAKRVLDRSRKGLYRRYVPQSDKLGYVRGALDLRDRARRPWSATLLCDFEEHSADVVENQILAWTLFTIARGGLCTDRVRPTVRRAYHTVQGASSLLPFRSSACVGRRYDRLSEDYRPMHALCRFFLDHAGAAHARGGQQMLPFLINMNRLFEEFVAAWLSERLPKGLELRSQEPMRVGQRDDLEFRIDILVRDARSGRPVLVLDSKYKAPDSPAPADIAQIVTYAEGTGCREAALVYPTHLGRPVRERIGDIRIRSLTFDLSGSLEDGGAALLRQVLEMAESVRAA